jgi:hypothetical protein
MKYRNVELSECELEDLIRRSPEQIEPGLKYIDHQVPTERGPLDVLLVDSGSALVIAELKVVEDEAMLVQAIDYYDDVVRHLDGYWRAYSQHSIDSNQDPRLFLIAPSFSISLLKRVQWINIPISPFTYQCIEIDDPESSKIVIYKEITASTLPRKVEAYSLEERFAYITDLSMRALASRFVEQICTWGGDRVLAEAIKYDISVKHSGRVCAYLYPRRKFFLVGTYDNDGNWITTSIKSESDVASVTASVRACFDRVSSGKSA